MQKGLILLTFILILSAASAQAAADKLQVTVSIVPQKYFVNQIAGDHVQVMVMVKPGSSPATYEPQPRQMAALSKASIYFAAGVPFERAWLPRFASANSKMRIISLEDSVVRMAMSGHHHEEEGHDHLHNDAMHGHKKRHETDENFLPDPHTWLSPALVRVMAMDIRDALIEADPKNTQDYHENYLDFVEDINELDSELAETFKKAGKRRSFMVYHPSWGYFARTYGLNQIPIELEGKKPSPKEMAQLIEIAEKKDIKTIFVQPQFSKKSAKAIASAIGAEVLVADPLAYDWEDNLEKVGEEFLETIK